jgi:hypothetical protein
MSKAANAVAGNWQLNGILTLHTGQPFTIDGSGCTGYWSACMPQLVTGQNPNAAPSGGRTPADWFNLAAFTIAPPLTEGNLGLQSNNGPPYKNLDFSVFKDFVMTERFKVQFRAEAFNLTNTPQFSTPNNSMNYTVDSHGVVNLGSLGQITSTLTGTERHIQFALRLQF